MEFVSIVELTNFKLYVLPLGKDNEALTNWIALVLYCGSRRIYDATIYLLGPDVKIFNILASLSTFTCKESQHLSGIAIP